MLTFSEFAQALHTYCGGRMKTSDFVLSMVANIMEEPSNEADIHKAANDRYNPLAELEISTLEKLFNGNRKLSKKNASAVLSRLDKEKFGDYISSFPIDTVSSLSKALYGNEADVNNFSIRCADIFTEILEKCASGANVVTSIKKATGLFAVEAGTEFHFDLPAHLDVIPKSELYLLMEASSLCPSCGKPLVIDKNNNALSKYKLINILPPSPTDEQKAALGELLDKTINKEDYENKIALCLDCANSYSSVTTRAECERLLDIKDRLRRNFAAFKELDKMYLEEQIEAVLRQIPSASQEQLSDSLSYDALRVKEKIPESNVPLIIKTEGFVVPYYRYIKTLFSQLEREGILNFEDVANEVLLSYRKLSSNGLTHDEIYTQLVNWFKNKTNAQNTLACEIIVAFFVQNCEVFHALTE